ncbi:lia operon protein LiaF [Anoxybacillus vitaminiphilus]|jgi:lia operon protein LiaF|uniref:Lia operon protein LiaF n=1 Tax=Paranoxybacillus vitaminiphilus TaxID=581036 RepID=A0A327YLB7_9BACL|nr:cell wall-active antibiotics response protein LiaF [Anoxybacillus vitaminiphilus]RAK20535.1 lia operon protein LiaF [Anoxybacillus vitaminiphilus]
MINQLKNDFISWVLFIGVILFLGELLFFHGGAIFFLIIAIGCIYIGRKRMPRISGTGLFWFGVISLIILVFNMFAFKFLLFASLIYVIIHFVRSKQKPTYITPVIQEAERIPSGESFLRRKPLLKNVLFGTQKTPEHVYEWNDVNVQTGIGDTIIDLSYTLLPKGESVIVIRNILGNIQIIVPYEIEVSVHHSVIAGSVTIFEHSEMKVWNETLHFQTAGYENAPQKIKIVTSMIVGNLEVKRR